MRLFLAELKKVILSNHGLLIILFALILQTVISLLPLHIEHPYSLEVYRDYTSRLEGEFTEEKAKYISSRLEEINEIIGQYQKKKTDYVNGVLSLEEYSDYTFKCNLANLEKSTMEYLAKKVDYWEASEDFDKEIFYDTEWQDFFDGIGFNFIELIVILCIIIPVFDKEFSTSSLSYILTSKRGKTFLCFCKISVAVILTFIFSVCMSMLQLGIKIYKNGIVFWDKSLCNILNYSGFGDLSIIEYFLTDAAIRAICLSMNSVVICLISVICKSTVFSFVFSFIYAIMPFLISNLYNSEVFYYIISSTNLMTMYSNDLNFSLFAILLAIKTMIFILLINCIWCKSGER